MVCYFSCYWLIERPYIFSIGINLKQTMNQCMNEDGRSINREVREQDEKLKCRQWLYTGCIPCHRLPSSILARFTSVKASREREEIQREEEDDTESCYTPLALYELL